MSLELWGLEKGINCSKIGSRGKVIGDPVINMSWCPLRESNRQTLVMYLDSGHVSAELVSLRLCILKLRKYWRVYLLIKEGDAKYCITGINMVQHKASDPYNFPTDPNIARIGGRKNGRCDPQIFTSCMAARPGRQPPKYKWKRLGFIIHAHCWVLFGRTIKTPLTEIILERFIKASRSHWRKSKLKDLDDYTFAWPYLRRVRFYWSLSLSVKFIRTDRTSFAKSHYRRTQPSRLSDSLPGLF